MGQYLAPLDLRTILVNYFLGTTELFLFAFIIVMSYAGAKFQMSNKLFLSLLAICSIIIAGYLGESIYVLVIFLIGLISFKGIARMVT